MFSARINDSVTSSPAFRRSRYSPRRSARRAFPGVEGLTLHPRPPSPASPPGGRLRLSVVPRESFRQRPARRSIRETALGVFPSLRAASLTGKPLDPDQADDLTVLGAQALDRLPEPVEPLSAPQASARRDVLCLEILEDGTAAPRLPLLACSWMTLTAIPASHRNTESSDPSERWRASWVRSARRKVSWRMSETPSRTPHRARTSPLETGLARAEQRLQGPGSPPWAFSMRILLVLFGVHGALRCLEGDDPWREDLPRNLRLRDSPGPNVPERLLGRNACREGRHGRSGGLVRKTECEGDRWARRDLQGERAVPATGMKETPGRSLCPPFHTGPGCVVLVTFPYPRRSREDVPPPP